MKYNISDIICVKIGNGAYVPYVFNNNGSKIKNLITNDIIKLDKSVSRSDRKLVNSLLEVREMFNKRFGECKICDLNYLYHHAPTSRMWSITHSKALKAISAGNSLWNDNEIEDSQVIAFVNEKNRCLQKINNHSEYTQEF